MSVTYSDIASANESIRTMKIERYDKKKGKMVTKEYAEVHERIKAFRQVFPTGFIVTNLLEDEDKRCVFRAEVGFFDDNGIAKVIGSGTAYEREDSSLINSTSYIENCETSAVGRALGMCGFGIDAGVASAEEEINAINQQEGEKLHSLDNLNPDPATINDLQVSIVENWSDERREWFLRSAQSIMEGLDVQKVKDVSELTAQVLINKVNKAKRGRR